MKRMQLVAAALCLIMLTTVGAGVVAAKQQENPRQAGSSSIYHYNVAPDGTHGKGTLTVNLDKKTFVFTGKGFEPSAQILLRARAAGSSDLKVLAIGKATLSGNLNLKGAWEAAAAPDDVVGATWYSGTLQRATAFYPDYTLVYTDNAGQKVTIYLPPNTITGGTLPSVIASPVALDYVYNFDDYHHTVQFVYQGVTYTAQFATTTHAPYLSGTAHHCNIPVGVDEYSGQLKVWAYDPESGTWWSFPAYNALVHIYVKDCDPPCGTGGMLDLGTTHTNEEGKWSKTTFETYSGSGHITYSLAGYPDITVDIGKC